MGDYSVLYRRRSDWVCRNKDSGDTAVLSFIDDLHFNKDNKRDILADIQMGSQLTSDFGILAKSRPVIEEVNKNLKLDYSYEQLASMVQATNQSDTRILRFTVTDTDPVEAKKIANEIANVTAERVAYVMSSDKPKIVEEAVVPKSPSSPNTKKNASVVALVFAFAAAAIIVLRYLLNDTIQNEDDVKKIS